MNESLIWLILAMVLGVAEALSLTATLGLLAGAALITSGLAAIGLPLLLQPVAFAVASASALVVIRPAIARHARRRRPEKFGVDALVGKKAYVLREVSELDGEVRIGGEEWTARPYDESLVIPAGTFVDVIRISGSTALVYPREVSWISQPR